MDGLGLAARPLATMSWVSGRGYDITRLTPPGSAGTFGMSADRAYNVLNYIPPGDAADQLAVGITTGAAAGKLLRAGVREVSHGVPGALIIDLETVAADGTGTKTFAISGQLHGGSTGRFVFIELISDGTPTLASWTYTQFGSPFGYATPGGQTREMGPYIDRAYGALPAAAGSVTGWMTNGVPLAQFRAV